MGPVAQVVSPGAALVAGCAVALCVLAVLVVVVRTSRRRSGELDAALTRSRAEVDALSRRVEELSHDVVRARRAAEEDREYVITSLGAGPLPAGPDASPHEVRPPDAPLPHPRQPVTRVLEEQLVRALADRPRSALQVRGVALVVRTVALGHGVRRALSADVLDRAAAESHVARRRSRRDRRRQLRRARREAA